ncbi:hypothetical protein Tco_1122247 [Tanacetum coccineum]|uniref:Uncharacterized protein n=1 Tax=Tanacetum coccineum TaxID=301880 RepID=A0ABQ5J009_9ASTR
MDTTFIFIPSFLFESDLEDSKTGSEVDTENTGSVVDGKENVGTDGDGIGLWDTIVLVMTSWVSNEGVEELKKKCTGYRSYALSWKPCQGDSLNLPDHRIRRRCCSLIPVKSDS